jgi:hypothetical protein
MAITAKVVNLTSNSGVQRKTPGDRFWAFVEIALDNSYPTGGYSLAALAALLGWNSIEHIIPSCLGPNLSAVCNDFSYDQPNQKVKLFAGNAEVANTTDVSAFKLYATVYGS